MAVKQYSQTNFYHSLTHLRVSKTGQQDHLTEIGAQLLDALFGAAFGAFSLQSLVEMSNGLVDNRFEAIDVTRLCNRKKSITQHSTYMY